MDTGWGSGGKYDAASMGYQLVLPLTVFVICLPCWALRTH